jgi:two-component sensor histidine kinase
MSHKPRAWPDRGAPGGAPRPESELAALFSRSFLVFGILLLSLFFFLWLYPQWLFEYGRIRTALVNRAELAAISVDSEISMDFERMAAISSRTQLRIILRDLADGRIDLETARIESRLRYNEGIAVYRHLLWAERSDRFGRTLVRYGERPAGIEAAGYRDAGGGASPRFAVLRDQDGRSLVYIVLPILQEGRLLGWDSGAFDLSSVFSAFAEFHFSLFQSATGAFIAPEQALVTNSDGSLSLSRVLAHSGLGLKITWPGEAMRPSFPTAGGPSLALFIVAATTLFVAAWFTIYRGSRRLIAALEKAVGEKELILRESDHRIKNNLNLMSVLISMHRDLLSDPAVTALLDDLQGHLRSVALIHESLDRSSLQGWVELRDYLRRVIELLVDTIAPGRGIQVNISGDARETDARTATTIGMIVTEISTNAIKYALASGGKLEATLSSRSDGGFAIEIRNGGSPFPEFIDPLTAESLGLSIIRGSVAQLHGTIEFSRKPCTTWRFEFPPAGAAGLGV